MEQVFASAVARERFQTLLLGLFAGLALVLAVVGLYGVMSYAVAQRTLAGGAMIMLGIAFIVVRRNRYQSVEAIAKT